MGTTRVKEWTVMTDELLYAKLAQHLADTGSPLPVLHGEHVGFLGVVYPILLAPFYAALDPVSAYDAGHVVNVVLFASTAIPVYLLARRIVSPACSLVVAGLSIAVPWAAHTATLMSESAAYPAFAWALLACHGALVEPSRRRDLIAIGGLALAFFTRTQFLVLAPVLPLAAIVVDGPRRALERHRVLAGACMLALVVAIPLAALGETHRLLGQYGVTATQGSLLPSGVWKAAAIRLDVVAVGIGVVPFLLGSGWIYSSLRALPAAERAFAALAAFSLPLVALETASFDIRFGGGVGAGFVRDRYVFYLAPIMLVAAAAALGGRLPLVGIAGATVFFAATVALADFPTLPGFWNDSPTTVLNGIIRSVGMPPGLFVAACGAAFGAACIGFAWLPRPPVLLGLTALLFAFCGSTTGYAFERLLSSKNSAGVAVTGGGVSNRNWVDDATDGPTGVLAYPISRVWGSSAIVWWDVEFWNDSLSRAYVGRNGRFTYTPFPSQTLRFGSDGIVAGTKHAPKYVLAAPNDSRFGLAGKQVAANAGLTLLKVSRPWRVRWTSRGLYPDGWTRPGRTAWVRVFAGKNRPTEIADVTLTVDSPPEATGTTTYSIAGRSGSAEPGERVGTDLSVCVPRGGHVDVPLRSQQTARIAGPPFGPSPGPSRDVGVVLSGVQVSATGEACTP